MQRHFFQVSQNVSYSLVIADNAAEVLYFALPISFIILKCRVWVLHCYILLFQNNKPLYSFEDNSDYVYDVMWSPTHPALFACVDGMGRLDLWNLNNDTEVRLSN